MSRSSNSMRSAGKAAGNNPVAACAILCTLAWVAGYWWAAVLIVVIAVIVSDIEDRAAAWWEDRGVIVRSLVISGFLVGCYLATTVRPQMWWFLAAGAVVALCSAVGAYLWHRNRVWREHYRRHIDPLHWSLAPVFGAKPEEFRPEDWLGLVGPDLLDTDGGIVIRLPTPRVPTENQQREAERIIGQKLGLRGHEFQWRIGPGSHHVHVYKAKPRPKVPEVVHFADVVDFIGSTKADELPLALGVGGKPVTVNLRTQTPHVLLSCQTGWGKSSAVGLSAAHVLHHGGAVVVPDVKVFSLDWCEDLPGVTYAYEIEDIHNTLVRVGLLVRERQLQAKAAPWNNKPNFPRVLVVLEELNACRMALADHWSDVKPRGGRPESPAIRAYKTALLMGRATNVNIIAITQSGTAQDTGGPAAREQYGTRILGWYTQNMWNMLIPQFPYVPATNRPGHGWVARGTLVQEAQFIYAEAEPLRDYAMAGRTTSVRLPQLPQADEFGAVPAGALGQLGRAPGLAALPAAVDPFGDDVETGPITLRAASSDESMDGGIVPQTLESLRTLRKRYADDFPEPLFRDERDGDFYDREALRAFCEDRLRRSEGRSNGAA